MDTLLQYATTIAIIGSLIFAAKKFTSDARQNKAVIISNLYKMFHDNPDMMGIFYEIEYSRFKYPDGFHGTPKEQALDKLLDYFETIGKLYANKILNETDLMTFKYRILSVYQNHNIKEYLKFLDRLQVDRRRSEILFGEFRKLAEILQTK